MPKNLTVLYCYLALPTEPPNNLRSNVTEQSKRVTTSAVPITLRLSALPTEPPCNLRSNVTEQSKRVTISAVPITLRLSALPTGNFETIR